jgi:putative hydrolase of the HAD superfamily
VTSRGPAPLPAALLLDLDDTILDDSGGVATSWRTACAAHASRLGDTDPETLRRSIARVSRRYWADPERHRRGRLALLDARREVVHQALADLGHDEPDVAAAIAVTYAEERDAAMAPFEGAIDTVEWLRHRGCRLALLTNGSAEAQREKIDRFDLARRFDHVLIEGELGYGKPDARVYELALARLRVRPDQAWMVGDHLEWDVAAPQRLGVIGIWIDLRGNGVPDGQAVRPDRIIRRLSDLREGDA